MVIKTKHYEILNFSPISGQLWLSGQKKGFGYNTKYPRMRCDQKTYFLRNRDKGKKIRMFEF